VEALLDTGMVLRWAHLSAGFVWIGLLWLLSWIDGGFVAGLDADTRRAVLPRLLPRVLWFLRWGAAFTWLGGVWYGFGHLAVQDPEGTLHWFTDNDRGRWLGVGFLLGSLMVFNVWFVIWPRWRLVLDAVSRGESPDTLTAWTRTAARAARLDVYLSVPLLYIMAAGRHAGELGHDRGPFLPSLAAVSVVGVAVAALLLHGIAPRVGRAWRAPR